jgi:hypothetical protein
MGFYIGEAVRPTEADRVSPERLAQLAEKAVRPLHPLADAPSLDDAADHLTNLLSWGGIPRLSGRHPLVHEALVDQV